LNNIILVFALAAVAAMALAGPAGASDISVFGPQEAGGQSIWRLVAASDAVNSNLSAIQTALLKASLALSETGLDGPDAQKVLSNLTLADAAVIDCITIGADGIVREVEPASFESIRGADLSGQEHVSRTINTRQYLGFYFIKAVEGSYAIDAEMPVFDRNGTFIGTVSLMFNNSQFFERVLAPLQPSNNSKIWVSRADDGMIIYETDSSQLLLNKSSSIYQEYPELLTLFDRMSLERTGYGSYEFLDQSHDRAIEKGCLWTTIPNRGTEMRLVLTLEL